jgi:hypothetical protein
MRYALGASTPGATEIAALDPLLTRLYTGTAFTSGAAWLTNCSTLTKIVQIDYTVLDGSALGITYAHTGAGTIVTSVPSEVAIVLSLLSNTRGKRYRGRLFLPCPIPGALDNSGNLNPTIKTVTEAQYLGMMSALAGIQWAPVIASYDKGTLHGVPTTWTPFATNVVTPRMDLVPDVQRRRKA